MPRITSITIGRTYNLGNYESLRLEATAEVEEGESTIAVRNWLSDRLQNLYHTDPLRVSKAQHIVDNARTNLPVEVKKAQIILNKYEETIKHV